uniref:Putative secreted protein n=1 Tax=Rhipicephalus microplus TaxID=6941 RepID=A0A6M2DDR0_RHIMP
MFCFFFFFFAWRQLFFLSSSSTTGLVSVICMRGVALRSACFGASVLKVCCHSGLLLNFVRAVREALLALGFRYHTLIV